MYFCYRENTGYVIFFIEVCHRSKENVCFLHARGFTTSYSYRHSLILRYKSCTVAGNNETNFVEKYCLNPLMRAVDIVKCIMYESVCS